MSTVVDVHMTLNGFGRYYSLREDARGRVILLSYDKDSLERIGDENPCPWDGVDLDRATAHLAALVSEDLNEGYSVHHIGIQSDHRDLGPIADVFMDVVDVPRLMSWRCSRMH